ncbi:heterokaryon incompatibility protein-domain-containing protein [Nemania sp. FL0031]|nr:heterokaryon incompatibility protein-domain-containing protein [Nemania sp. FL0031]
MRLLNTDSLAVQDFSGLKIPPYSILSHTWGEDECLFQDLREATRPKKAGFAKIKCAAQRAKEDGFKYIWIDNCCIDKSSSVELSEAINSMYQWYEEALVCYAYLVDVPTRSSVVHSQADRSGANERLAFDTHRLFRKSRWFTRGWTLQELIAPSVVEFYAADWTEIGTKSSLRQEISSITGIEVEILRGGKRPSTCNVAERMSWAACRETSRIEDEAYCMMGLFNVHMPLIYGEGRKAFLRLQEEIMKTTEDYSLFTWGMASDISLSLRHTGEIPGRALHKRTAWDALDTSELGFLAWRPAAFAVDNRSLFKYSLVKNDTDRVCIKSTVDVELVGNAEGDRGPPLLTSRGLRLSMSLQRLESDIYLAYLNCKLYDRGICIALKAKSSGSQVFHRLLSPHISFFYPIYEDICHLAFESIYVVQSRGAKSNATPTSFCTGVEFDFRELDITYEAFSRHIMNRPFSNVIPKVIGESIEAAPGVIRARSIGFEPLDIEPYDDDIVLIFCKPEGICDSFISIFGNGWCDILASSSEIPMLSLEGRRRAEVEWNEDEISKLVLSYKSRLETLYDRATCHLKNITVAAAYRRRGEKPVLSVKVIPAACGQASAAFS